MILAQMKTSQDELRNAKKLISFTNILMVRYIRPIVEFSKPLKDEIIINKNVPNTAHHYERQDSCKFCSYFTNNPRAILYHRKNYHNEKIQIYECK
jgi:hypothetical protein